MKVRVGAYQKKLGEEITPEEIVEFRKTNLDFLCFPEYFFVNKELGTFLQTDENMEHQISRIKKLSIECRCVVIGGTLPEKEDDKIYNTTFIFDNGNYMGKYRKKNLFFAEEGKITPGSEYTFFEWKGLRFSVLICADVLTDESFLFMKEKNVKLIFAPTFSPRREELPEVKFARDREIFVRGAALSGTAIVKVCGTPSPFRSYIQGRSLIADKNEVLFRVPPEKEDDEMFIVYDLHL